MDTTWPLSAAVVGLLILQTNLARNQLGSWLAPGAFFGLMWAVVGVLSLSIAPEFRIWPGILWVLFMSCTAHLGALLVSSGESFSYRTSASEESSVARAASAAGSPASGRFSNPGHGWGGVSRLEFGQVVVGAFVGQRGERDSIAVLGGEI